MSAVAWLVHTARDVVDAALVRPVREGVPRPHRWPPGLLAVTFATTLLFVVLLAVAAGAGWLRSVDRLLVSYVTGMTLPSLAVPLLLAGLVWSMVLLHVAAVRTTWWPRLALLAVSVVAVGLFWSQAWDNPVLMGVAALLYLALWVLILVRSRRPYAPWEFAVVGLWVVVALYVPWLGTGYGALFGLDHRLPALQGTLETLQVLSVPALLAAGCAPALITTTAGETLARREFPRWLGLLLLAAVVCWRVGDVGWSLWNGSRELSIPSLVAAGLVVGSVLTLSEIIRRLAARAALPGPGALPEIWESYVWPLAMSLGWVVLLMIPLSVGRVLVMGTAFGQEVVEPVMRAFLMYGPQTFRFAVAVVAVVIAWRIAKEGQAAGALLLTAFFVYTVIQRVAPLTGGTVVGAASIPAMAAVSSGLAIVAIVAYGLAGRLTARRVGGAATVLVLGAIFPHRNALDDPLSAILGYAGLAVLLFGLVWQALTNADYLEGDTRTFPRATRVYLYLANTLFAMTGAAYVALSRVSGAADATDWTELGDDLLGIPLFVAALVSGLWLSFEPQQAPRVAAVEGYGRT